MCNIYHIDNMKTLSSSILIDLIWVISLAVVGLLYIVGLVFLFLVFNALKKLSENTPFYQIYDACKT